MNAILSHHVNRAKRVHSTVVNHRKTIKVCHRSRTWMEVLTCTFTALDTHFRPLMVVSVVWAIIDITLVFLKDEL